MRWFLRGGWRWTILAVSIVAFLWFVPQLQGEYFSHKVPAKERPALVNEYRRTWAQIVGGFGLLLGLCFTWRRIEISQRELEATRDQQVTERFTRAIDQLGATNDEGEKKLEIRLGGIYALERIAGDSLAMQNFPGRDYSTVMEVLTAYVRENTTQAPRLSNGSSAEASLHVEATAEADEEAQQPAPPEPRRFTADIQAILDVLRRTQARVPEKYRTRLDLHEAKLQGANLRGAKLQEANLRGAKLQEAILERANFQDAKLPAANLQGANLEGAFLWGAFLRGAKLQEATLERANFQGANLQEANLYEADLQEAKLRGADLQEATLERANLQEANLQGASLVVANFQEANLGGANLGGANLGGASLLDANVTDEQLADTLSLQGATMPDGSKHP